MRPDQGSFDPQRMLKVLARHGVRCVVIGAYAAALWGVEIVTRDIDITPASDEANLRRLARALEELHAAIRVRASDDPVPLPADPRLLARAEILNLITDAGELDITVRPDGTEDYEDLRQAAHRHPLGGGLHITIASLEDVIRSKTAAGRAKDLAALPQLRAALERRRTTSESQGPRAHLRGAATAFVAVTVFAPDPGALEEERRLFYVACTRAKDTLILTHARVRGGRETGGPCRSLMEAGLLSERSAIAA